MKKFLVLYKSPVSVFESWTDTPAEERKAQEKEMQEKWGQWMAINHSKILETAGAGKTKLVAKDGTTDTKNDVMLYSLVEADSQEEAASMFKDHPHLGIPEATIEVMEANVLPGMAGM